MWTCVRCTAKLTFKECEPSIDHFGVYFLCPRCGYRNKLKNIGRQGGPVQLVQTGD